MTCASKCPASATDPTHRDEVGSHWPTVAAITADSLFSGTTAGAADKRNKLETNTIEILTTSSAAKQVGSERTGWNNQSQNKVGRGEHLVEVAWLASGSISSHEISH